MRSVHFQFNVIVLLTQQYDQVTESSMRSGHLQFNVAGSLTIEYVRIIYSSISSGLNALAAVTLQDMVRSFCLPNMKESTAAKVSKGIGKAQVYKIHSLSYHHSACRRLQ